GRGAELKFADLRFSLAVETGESEPAESKEQEAKRTIRTIAIDERARLLSLGCRIRTSAFFRCRAGVEHRQCQQRKCAKKAGFSSQIRTIYFFEIGSRSRSLSSVLSQSIGRFCLKVLHVWFQSCRVRVLEFAAALKLLT